MLHYLVTATLPGTVYILHYLVTVTLPGTVYILHYLVSVTLPCRQEEKPGSVVVRGVELVDQLLSLLS